MTISWTALWILPASLASVLLCRYYVLECVDADDIQEIEMTGAQIAVNLK